MYAAQSSQFVIVIRKQCGQTSHVLQLHVVVSVVALLILAIAMLAAVVDRHLSPHRESPDRQFLDPHAHADEVVKNQNTSVITQTAQKYAPVRHSSKL